jgi:hypothetical protein
MSRVLDRHDADLGPLVLHLGEHLGDAPDRQVLGADPELPERGQVREGGRGSEVGDAERALEGAGGREDLPPDRPDGVGGQRPPVQGQQALDDRVLALRSVDRRADLALRLSHFVDERRALVEEFEELAVEVIDPGPPFSQTHRRSEGRSHDKPT